jgi:2-methylisocitrate lyase-like PEP mutase family enzyme
VATTSAGVSWALGGRDGPAARAATRDGGADLVINARVDTYLLRAGAPDLRFDDTVRRARAYRAAGADCVFVPGVVDESVVGALVRAIDGPVNVMAAPRPRRACRSARRTACSRRRR